MLFGPMVAVVFVFGLIVGSFLNVVILRHKTGKSAAGGRSECMSCGGKLRFWELVPVLSFIALRGKCARCGARISWQYPLVELSVATLLTLVYGLHQPLLPMLALMVVMALLAVLVVYDLKHKILPDVFMYPLIAFSAFYGLQHVTTWYGVLMVALSGVVVAAPLFLLWAGSRGRWMGFGDVKLAVAMGFLLGMYLGFSALWYGFILGAIYGVTLLMLGKVRAKSEVAFGPFLVLGTLIALFTGIGFLECSTGILALWQ